MVVVYQRCINALLDFVANPFLPFRFERQGSRRKVKAWCTPPLPGVYVVRGRTAGPEGNPHTHPSRRPGPTSPAVPSDSNYSHAVAARHGSYCRDHSERPHTVPFYAHPWPASPQVSSHRRLVFPAAHHRLLPKPSPPGSAQADSYQQGGGPTSHCLLPTVCWHSVERGLAVGEAAKLGLLNGTGAPFEGCGHTRVCVRVVPMFAASCSSLTPVSHMACALLGRLLQALYTNKKRGEKDAAQQVHVHV